MTDDIYPMPAFATFQVADLAASTRWYVDGLGFHVVAELPGPSGRPALVHLRRERYQDLLLVPAAAPADTPPGSGVTVSFSAGDLDALAARARAVGGGSVEGPAPTPWNTVDVVAYDPDGYRVVLTGLEGAGHRSVPVGWDRVEEATRGGRPWGILGDDA